MSLYNGPPRPGARGGRAEFSWDNVKSDKDREFYLGHSVKASTGRWQKGKDLFWYAKDKGDSGVTQEELEAVKAREREMMAEALGLKPKSAPSTRSQPALEKHEVERLLKGGGDEQDAAPAGAAAEADRIKGLGFQSGAAVAVREEVHEVLPGTLQPGLRAPGGAKLLTVEQLAALERASAGAAKDGGKAHKAKKSKKDKKEKKEKKEKHKKKRKRERSRSRSRSPSSSSDSGSRDRSRGRHKHSRQLPPPPQEQQHHHHSMHGGARDGDRVPLRRGDTHRAQEEPVRQGEQQQRQQVLREPYRQQQQQPPSSRHAADDGRYDSRNDRHPVGSSDWHGREARAEQDDREQGFDRGEGSRRRRDSSRDRDGGRGRQGEQLPRGSRPGAGYSSRRHSRNDSRSQSRGQGRSRSPLGGGRRR